MDNYATLNFAYDFLRGGDGYHDSRWYPIHFIYKPIINERDVDDAHGNKDGLYSAPNRRSFGLRK